MSDRDVGAEIAQRLANDLDDDQFAALFSPDGLARQCDWIADDGWIVSYTTTRIRAGTFDGKFAAMAYRPVGPGARTGKATCFKRVYFRTFSTRKAARARAEKIYYDHSPQAAARHGVSP